MKATPTIYVPKFLVVVGTLLMGSIIIISLYMILHDKEKERFIDIMNGSGEDSFSSFSIRGQGLSFTLDDDESLLYLKKSFQHSTKEGYVPDSKNRNSANFTGYVNLGTWPAFFFSVQADLDENRLMVSFPYMIMDDPQYHSIKLPEPMPGPVRRVIEIMKLH